VVTAPGAAGKAVALAEEEEAPDLAGVVVEAASLALSLPAMGKPRFEISVAR
jgi:hypothetical protein